MNDDALTRGRPPRLAGTDCDEIQSGDDGVGWWTTEQAMPAVDAGDLCETTVLVSSDREKAADVAADSETVEHAITYEEFHDGAASDAYDAVYIVTPNALHLPYVETAAERTRRSSESRREATIERAERWSSVCDEHDATLMIAYRMHTEPAVRRAKDLIDEGYIGEPLFVHGNMTEPILELVPDPDQWRLDGELSGGCAVMETVRPGNPSWFLRPPRRRARTGARRRRACARRTRPSARSVSPRRGDAVCTGRRTQHDSHISDSGQRTSSASTASTPGRPRAPVDHEGTTVEIDFEQVDQMEEVFEYAADRILTDAPIGPDGEHGVLDMRLIEAIYDAGESGRVVTLD